MTNFEHHILLAISELGPCSGRAVVEALDEDRKDVAEAIATLHDVGAIKQYSNGQWAINDNGKTILDTFTPPKPTPKPNPATMPMKPANRDPEPAPHHGGARGSISPRDPEDLPPLESHSTDGLIEIVRNAEAAKQIIKERLRSAGIIE